MKKTTLTVAGWCVTNRGLFKWTITISKISGLIIHIGPYRSDADIIARDLIFPTFLDNHVHGREDVTQEESYKEDFFTLSLSAINGGVGHVAGMGNDPHPPVDLESYLAKMELVGKSKIPVTLYAMTGPGTSPIPGMRVPYKFCHTATTGKNPSIFFPNAASLLETAPRYVGQENSHHCEDSEIIAERAAEILHELRRPPLAEVKSVDVALLAIETIFGRGNICHCSVGRGLDNILLARMRGVEVTFELAPHHWFYDLSMVTYSNRHILKMNPPLRSPKDRERCLEVLRAGEGVTYSSDHAPHGWFERIDPILIAQGKNPSGLPLLDVHTPLTTHLMEVEGFTPQQILRVCCENPAIWFNKFLGPGYGYGYGRIAPGYMGSVTLVDRGTSFRVTKDKLRTKCGWSPFEGHEFPGSVDRLIVKGQVMEC